MLLIFFFFFNDTATTEIYTLSLHDALPIYLAAQDHALAASLQLGVRDRHRRQQRSEEHTSELQSPCNLVCRLLLEKKKKELHDVPFAKYHRRPHAFSGEDLLHCTTCMAQTR